MINYVVLDEKTAIELSLPNSERIIGEFAGINVFVGKNNAGKSRLLRKLFEETRQGARGSGPTVRLFDYSSNPFDNSRIVELIIEELNQKPRSHDYPLQKEYSRFIRHFQSGIQSNVKEILEFVKNIGNQPFQDELLNGFDTRIASVFDPFKTFKNKQLEYLDEISTCGHNLLTPSLYIPILRGLRPIQYLEANKFSSTDSFKERTLFDYFQRGLGSNVFTGLSLYEDIKKLLLGTEEDRQLIADFESFLSTHIFSEKVTLIPKYDKDVLHIKIGDKPQYEIYNLGDGLQTIITILFPIFIGKDIERAVFIEEPEAHLHPHWQAKLFSALKQIPNQQYFITTHSNVFINDPTSLLFLIQQKDGQMHIQDVKFEGEKLDILRDLGYKQSDLLQANFILWVEGPSDQVYLNYWIKQLDPSLTEGIHYTILFFGGSTYKYLLTKEDVVDLSFIKNINRNFGIIMDSDRTKKNEKLSKNKEDIQSHFDDNNLFCWITQYRELENYLDHQSFESAVKTCHKKTDITISQEYYEDRNTVIDNLAKQEFKSTIKLPETLFSTIQKNKNGKTTSISDNDLRNAIEQAIQNTGKSTFNIDKNKVAQNYVSQNPIISDGELKEKLVLLITEIKKANGHENLLDN